MEALKSFDFLLGVRRDEALAVKFAVGAGVGLVTGREEVGGDVAFAGDVGDNLDFLLNFGKLGEEFGICVAFEEILGDRIASLEGGGELLHVSVVKEDLCFEDAGGLGGDGGVVAEGQVDKYLHRLAALHVREEFKGKGRGNFVDDGAAQNDLLEKGGFFNRRTRGAGQGVVDEKIEGVFAVLVAGVFDLRDDFGHQLTAVDGFGVQFLIFAILDFFNVVRIQAHDGAKSVT